MLPKRLKKPSRNTRLKISDHPRSILITGASSGIGEALALHYARSGVTLFISGRNAGRIEFVAAACRHRGAVVETAVVDVANQPAMRAWIEQADAKEPLDLVVANAGISGGTGAGGEMEAQVREIFSVNVDGVFNTIWPALPLMKARGRGQIAVISSLAAFSAWPGAPAYSASKAAVRFYGEALRTSLLGTGVRVSVVCPGFVKSRMTAVNDYTMPLLMDPEKAARIIAKGLHQNRVRIASLTGQTTCLPPNRIDPPHNKNGCQHAWLTPIFVI